MPAVAGHGKAGRLGGPRRLALRTRGRGDDRWPKHHHFRCGLDHGPRTRRLDRRRAEISAANQNAGWRGDHCREHSRRAAARATVRDCIRLPEVRSPGLDRADQAERRMGCRAKGFEGLERFRAKWVPVRVKIDRKSMFSIVRNPTLAETLIVAHAMRFWDRSSEGET